MPVRRTEQELVAERASMKAALKADFIKQQYNPYRFINGNQSVFDPAIQRYIAMKACEYDHFRPTPKTSVYGILQLVPIALLVFFGYRQKVKNEEEYRAGKISYAHRRPKFS